MIGCRFSKDNRAWLALSSTAQPRCIHASVLSLFSGVGSELELFHGNSIGSLAESLKGREPNQLQRYKWLNPYQVATPSLTS